MPALPRVRIGLAGAGRWGGNYIRTLAGMPDCRLVGVADPRPPGELPVPVYPDLETMLDRADPEAVIIATPDPTHFSLARTCLESGRDLLVEKPLALDRAEADTLRSLASGRGLVLAVGQTTLYHPGYCHLRTELARGAAGRPQAAKSIRTSRGIPGSDLFWDLAPHSVALAVGLFGRPETATVFDHPGLSPDPPRARFRLAFAGLAFDAELGWEPGPARRGLVILGSKCNLEFDETAACRPLPLTALCRDFIDCCRTRALPRADSRIGTLTVAIIQALHDSIAAGCVPVALPGTGEIESTYAGACTARYAGDEAGSR